MEYEERNRREENRCAGGWLRAIDRPSYKAQNPEIYTLHPPTLCEHAYLVMHCKIQVARSAFYSERHEIFQTPYCRSHFLYSEQKLLFSIIVFIARGCGSGLCKKQGYNMALHGRKLYNFRRLLQKSDLKILGNFPVFQVHF